MAGAGRLTIGLHEEDGRSPLAGTILPMPPGPQAVVTVADEGVGMDARTIERAFDPFYSSQPRAVASGLGLSIVHGTMTAHEGGIAVQSTPGIGTRIRLAFPVHQEAPTASTPAARAPLTPADSLRSTDPRPPARR